MYLTNKQFVPAFEYTITKCLISHKDGSEILSVRDTLDSMIDRIPEHIIHYRANPIKGSDPNEAKLIEEKVNYYLLVANLYDNLSDLTSFSLEEKEVYDLLKLEDDEEKFLLEHSKKLSLA